MYIYNLRNICYKGNTFKYKKRIYLKKITITCHIRKVFKTLRVNGLLKKSNHSDACPILG
jgi:hypothetical protein